MDRIQKQASKLVDLLLSSETAETYQKAFNLTGTLLKELAQLIWLTLISAFVFGAWVSDTSVKAGKSIRDWVDNKGSDVAEAAEGKPASETGKDLLEKGRTSVTKLLNQAREQLGLEPQEIPAPAPTPSKPVQASNQPTSSASAPASPTPDQKPAPMAAQKPPVAAQPSAAAAQAQKPASTPSNKPSSQPSVSATSDDDDWPPKTTED